jgi:hypothetical protein
MRAAITSQCRAPLGPIKCATIVDITDRRSAARWLGHPTEPRVKTPGFEHSTSGRVEHASLGSSSRNRPMRTRQKRSAPAARGDAM